MKEFDYYIFIDFSENLIGYNIIAKDNLNKLLQKITKFVHYRGLRHKRAYIHSIKKVIEKNEIRKYLLKNKIRNVRETPEIYIDIVEFIKKNSNCIIFISVDNKQFSNFEKLVENFGRNTKVVKESELKKESKEYKLSLILDTLLNIERLKYENK